MVNAIAHRDYVNKGTHIQVEVFDDRVSITNFGGLAKGLTKEELRKRSMHRNPNIVNLFHRSNFIEKLGTGLLRIDSELKNAGLPKVELEINEYWFSIVFKRRTKVINEESSNFDGSAYLSEQDKKVLTFCKETPRSRVEIFEFLQLSNETRNFNRNLLPLIDKGWLRMTEPSTPRSKNQKYIITNIGLSLISRN